MLNYINYKKNSLKLCFLTFNLIYIFEILIAFHKSNINYIENKLVRYINVL